MYKSIYKKIALPVLLVFFSYSMSAIGASVSYGVALTEKNQSAFFENLNAKSVSLKMSSIKPVKGKKSQSDMMSVLLSVDSKTIKMSSLKSSVIKSLSFDSEELSKPVTVIFSKNPNFSKANQSSITLNSIQSKKGKLLLNVSCSSGGSDSVRSSISKKSLRHSRKRAINKVSRQ